MIHFITDTGFISKAGGEALTEPRRVIEAQWNGHRVDQILAADPDAYVVVLGDLNDYYDSAPLRALTQGETPSGRLVNVAGALPPEEWRCCTSTPPTRPLTRRPPARVTAPTTTRWWRCLG